jgi:hypothetical protein
VTHITRALPRALEGASASEGSWSLSFINVMVNPLLMYCHGKSAPDVLSLFRMFVKQRQVKFSFTSAGFVLHTLIACHTAFLEIKQYSLGEDSPCQKLIPKVEEVYLSIIE